jgi:hypothetical protein
MESKFTAVCMHDIIMPKLRIVVLSLNVSGVGPAIPSALLENNL